MTMRAFLPSLFLAAGLSLVIVESADAQSRRGPGVLSRAGNNFGRAARNAGTSTANAARTVAGNSEATAGLSIERGGSVFEETFGEITGEGNDARGCAGSAGLLNGSVSANAGASVGNGRPGGTSRPTGGNCGPLGSGTGAGAEVSLVQLSGECATAYGTVGGQVQGGRATASISLCEVEVRADLVYGEVSYTTPSVGGCGVEVSGEVGVGAGIGLGAGAGLRGTVGGRVRAGPVSVTLAANVSVDGGALADCAGRAVAAIGNGISNAASSVGNAVSGFVGGLFGGGGPSFSDVLAASSTAAGNANANNGGWFRP